VLSQLIYRNGDGRSVNGEMFEDAQEVRKCCAGLTVSSASQLGLPRLGEHVSTRFRQGVRFTCTPLKSHHPSTKPPRSLTMRVRPSRNTTHTSLPLFDTLVRLWR